ncbi:hypothetical protein IH799_09675, partial [candidate division KSB1 bacterium]|nr:hypothetical protein [candidate division KSB1 bacterium]
QRVEQASRRENRDRLCSAHERAEHAVRETIEWIERREREIRLASERHDLLIEQTAQAEESLGEGLVDEERVRVESERLRDGYERGAQQLRAIEEQLRELRWSILIPNSLLLRLYPKG